MIYDNPSPKKSPVFESVNSLKWSLREVGLISGAIGLAFWTASLVSYSLKDKAWSTSGNPDAISDGHVLALNWGGHFGAWIADLSYFLFGFSVWWMVAAATQVWLLALLRQFGSEPSLQTDDQPVSRSKFWFSLAVLVVVSGSLEWSRLYYFESLLPGHSGGVIGYVFGSLSLKVLGFSGSSLLFVLAGVTAVSNVFNFSWMDFAQTFGAAIERVIIWSRKKNEEQDVCEPEKVAIERQSMIVPPVAVDLTKDTREAKSSSKPAPASVQRTTPAPVSTPSPVTNSVPVPAPRPAQVSSPTSASVSASVPKATSATSAPVSSPVSTPAQRPIAASVPSPVSVAASRVVPTPAPTPRPVATPAPRPIAKPVAPSLSSASKLPPMTLLDEPPLSHESVSTETLEMTSQLIERELKEFGVVVRVVAAAPGPVITRYEIEPAAGVKGAQIVTRAKDLARSLSVASIRVIETIPGKNCMALELPNPKRQSIKLSEILDSQVYNDATSPLTIGLGKDIAGNAMVADLGKMPHCLVAGTTGSGKSVGINAMILSLLFKASPSDVRLLLIDPKMLEMSVYEGIPHLLAPVVTDMKQAAHGLNWCVLEMEKRYRLMSKMGVRNLAGYNAKIDEAKAHGEFVYNPFSLTPEQPEPLERLPYIVVVIDELADLMMVVGKKIEELIARLAQKARAAGIHLVLATQRPSVDVITGLIKANIPTRLSFQVSSKIDSRTILDQAGAEALLGMGDMLYILSGTGYPIRVHGAFVSDDEVHRVVAYLKKQGGEPNYVEGVLESSAVNSDADGNATAEKEKDPLYDQAVNVVLETRRASISMVQRHLKIGYNRAANLVEDMEKAGLVSAMGSNGQREILTPKRT